MCLCVYLYAWDGVLWICELEIADPEGQVWFNWHLYDPGLTVLSLQHTGMHTHTNTYEHSDTPAAPSSSPLISWSLWHCFDKGDIHITSYSFKLFIHIFIHFLLLLFICYWRVSILQWEWQLPLLETVEFIKTERYRSNSSSIKAEAVINNST